MYMRTERIRATITALVMLLAVSLPLAAGFGYRLDVISFDPIYEVYAADGYGGDLAFSYIADYSGFPGRVWQENAAGEGGVMVFPLDHGRFRAEPCMARFRLAETFTFLRSTFSFGCRPSPVIWDLLTLQGGASIVFDGEISDLMGYDGCYFVGTALSLGDAVSMRFGMNHWCTHYGDAVMKNLSPSDRALFDVNYKYLRNNLAFGISVRPVGWLRLYGEYQWLPEGGFIKPYVFSPDHGKNGPYWGKDYDAAVACCGIELSYPFWKDHGNTSISYDLHMYEEGKVILFSEDGRPLKVPSDPGAPREGEIYLDTDAPWSLVHGIVFSQEFTDWFSLELGWHTGRSPLNSMFFERDCSWAHIGMRFDPHLTCRGWDTGER